MDTVLGADALRYFLLREIPFGQDGSFSFDALVRRYNGDLANGYGNLVSRVVNMMHKFFGGVLPEAGADTAAESALRASAEKAIAEFGPAFDELNFSEALKSLWLLVAETDGYLTASAPWKKPADRSDADHAALQARVLANAAEAIRIITALVYPILPASAAKVWQQLGLGSIEDAARQSFLTDLAWGGLKAGTRFSDPAPLFPAQKRTRSNVCRIWKTKTTRAQWKPRPVRKRPARPPRPPPPRLWIVPPLDGHRKPTSRKRSADADHDSSPQYRAAGGHGQGTPRSRRSGQRPAEDHSRGRPVWRSAESRGEKRKPS